ncbi:hypothetical protein [Spiroplasma endosymbiont of Labia minor]|uniref:hypothetical protein n=1 Tax=Spiroplasma endosymbiont of Labia minor TaxID=3066305 RepID=UPI0030D5ADF8
MGSFIDKYNNLTLICSTYNLICQMIWILTAILFVIMMWFIVLELIKINRKTLIFLRSNGISRAQLSLLSVITVLVPILLVIILSLILVAPVGNIFMYVFQQVMSYHLNMWGNINWWSGLISLVMFVIIGFIFFIINLFSLSPKKLQINSIERPNNFEIGLNKITKIIFKKTQRI